MKVSNQQQQGFTLIELMIVVAILSILASVAAVAYTKWIRSAREAEAQSVLSDIRIKQEAYFTSFRQYAGECGGDWDGWAPKKSTPGESAVLWSDIATTYATAAWIQLGIFNANKHLYFRYYIESGAPTEAPSTIFSAAGIDYQNEFWYAARAVHDLDGNGKCEGFEIYSQGDLISELKPEAANLCP
ncbi:MAG: prepilin-type N-terminal cleavage/methylation domain-containing protein [Deltaproteobacteria bacterium]|nr:prepilin-type N-terminal cleavage/methylation domain-containing protein [Deltaproteobacteria bacterium]